jgi:iron complex transport system substrate-binding protein
MRALLLSVFLASPALAIDVKDDYGREIVLQAPARRIVSLSPHLTELAYAANAGDRLVGAVDYSDYPEAARKLPRVGSDARIDLEAVLALYPDLVIAWPNAGTRRAVDRLAELGVPTFRSEPRELEDIPRTIEKLAALAGTSSRAAAEFRDRAAALKARYSGKAPVRVFYQVWERPLQTVNGDHVISKVIRLCGGENVFADLAQIAPVINHEALLHARPEVVVTSAPGVEGARYIPGDLMQRHTPRLLEGAQRLCEILEEVRSAR